MERVDCVVIGAGVVGLAVARSLAIGGSEVVVVDAAETFGTETSSRNSEIIHAGIYYPAGSLKAQLCVDGKQALYRYCEERGVAHRRCGKLIVATRESQLEALRQIEQKALGNGVNDLRWLTPEQVADCEPALHCVAALESPSTGLIDVHAYMLALQADAEAAGALFAFRSPVIGGHIDDQAIRLEIGDDETMQLQARVVVNSAGLHAGKVASTIDGLPTNSIPRHYYAKGNYYSLAARCPFTRPIYPVPEQAGLGVHLTVDLGGQARFGPDVEWVDTLNYDVDPSRADAFYAAVRCYWPDLPDAALQPGYAGIRPKLQAPGEAPADFVIQSAETHGVNGLVNLYGIESPGLTASLSIAEEVAHRLDCTRRT